MKIRMLVSMQGAKSRTPGDVLEAPADMSEAEALRLIDAGFAAEIEPEIDPGDKETETNTAAPLATETTDTPRPAAAETTAAAPRSKKRGA